MRRYYHEKILLLSLFSLKNWVFFHLAQYMFQNIFREKRLNFHQKFRKKNKRSSFIEKKMYALNAAAAAAKSLQSCLTLWDPINGSLPGSTTPGILQARTLEWVTISFSNAWKWSCSVVSDSLQPHGLQPTRLLHPWDSPGKSTGVGCHCLLWCSE